MLMKEMLCLHTNSTCTKKIKFMKKDVIVVYQNNYAESGANTAHASPSFGRQNAKTEELEWPLDRQWTLMI